MRNRLAQLRKVIAFGSSRSKLPGSMKLVPWMRFTWDLAQLPAEAPVLERRYGIRLAAREEKEKVLRVIISSFALDKDWFDTLKTMQGWIENQIDDVFSQRSASSCLVVTHGSRIIGASALNTERESANHLLTGTCVLNEYRNRGLGTGLLYHSLRTLREADLEKAHGITKSNVPAAKFLYRKYNSVSEPCDVLPEMVGL